MLNLGAKFSMIHLGVNKSSRAALVAAALSFCLHGAARADDDDGSGKVKSLKQAQAEAAKKKKKKKGADDAAPAADPAASQYPGLPPLPPDAANGGSSIDTAGPSPSRGVIIPGGAAPAPLPEPAPVEPSRVVQPAPSYAPPPAPEPTPAPAVAPPAPAYAPPAPAPAPAYVPPAPQQTYVPTPAPAYAPAPAPAPTYTPATSSSVEQILANAAQAEKQQQCEAAYAGYQQALDQASRVTDRQRSGELESIAQNKIDKLDECYRACQPNARQRSLFESAQGAKDRGESKRAVQIARKLLTGKDQRCVFWGSVKEFLAAMPGQADELANDKFDPCEVTPEVQKDLDAARSSARREQQSLNDLMADRSHLSGHMDEMVSLWHELDQTRQRIFEMREEFLDCDAVYKPLVEDAANLHDVFEKSEGAILAGYRGQIESLSHKVRAAQAQLGEKSKLLDTRSEELDRLKKQMDEMGSVNEDLYNSLFDLGATESVSFTTTVEGRRIEKPMEEINALMADESKVISTLQSKYPEYFADGVNVEAMKRKRLVLEKIAQLEEKFQKQSGNAHPGGQRAIDETQATIRMLDKAIGAKEGQVGVPGEKKDEGGSGGGVPTWLIALGLVLAVGGFVFWRVKSASSDQRTGIR